MPQLQNVVVNDRATPAPVAHTFIPRDIVGNVGTVQENGTSAAGSNQLSISHRFTGTGRRKVTIKGVFPITQTETINGIGKPTVVRVARASLEFDFDDFSSEQERNDVVGMIANALAPGCVLVNDCVVKGQGIY